MALIKCPECGKMISKRAPKCPKCGKKMGQNTVKLCPECGQEVDLFINVCPNCAFPFNDVKTVEQFKKRNIEQEESIHDTEKKKKDVDSKTTINIFKTIILLLIIGVFFLYKYTNQKSPEIHEKKYSDLEQSILKTKSHSCIFITNLHSSGDKKNKLYMFVYADNDDVSRGFVVYLHSSDDLCSVLFKSYYRYEIKNKKMILTQGGQIDAWGWYGVYRLKPDSRIVEIDIMGTGLRGDAPDYDGVSFYSLLKDREPNSKWRNFEKFKHLTTIEIP